MLPTLGLIGLVHSCQRIRCDFTKNKKKQFTENKRRQLAENTQKPWLSRKKPIAVTLRHRELHMRKRNRRSSRSSKLVGGVCDNDGSPVTSAPLRVAQ